MRETATIRQHRIIGAATYHVRVLASIEARGVEACAFPVVVVCTEREGQHVTGNLLRVVGMIRCKSACARGRSEPRYIYMPSSSGQPVHCKWPSTQ